MRGRYLLAPLLLLSPTLVHSETEWTGADAILGTWELANDEGAAHVRIERVDDELVGRIVWLEHPTFPPDDPEGMGGRPCVDRNNPDPELRERRVLGIRVLRGLRYEGDGTWTDGRVYAPDTGKTYRCRVRLKDDGTVEVKAYVKVLFAKIGRSVRCHRVASAGRGELLALGQDIR